MTRVQFLNDLYHHLYGMTKEQAEQHLTYYAEMLADRIEEGMSEDEAVASMEDVETIARRILEEEGLPYTPPEERSVTPPAYPDASKLSGGGGTRGYQVPKKWNGRKILQIALWTVAALALVSTASRRAWERRNTDIPIYDYCAESVPIEEVSAIQEWEYDGDYMEAPYAEGYAFNSGTYDFADHAMDAIDIQWASGVVYIQSWSGDEIQVQEYAHSELSERTRMSCRDDGGTLTIRYREGVSLGGVKDDKWLTVLIPDGMIEDLAVETTSADIRLNGLETENLTVSTASGYIMPADCYTQTAELRSISGELILDSLYADTLDISTTSGGILGNVSGSAMDICTTSGNISLDSDGPSGQVGVETISGDVWFSVEDPSVQSIGVSSVSGDVSLLLPLDMGFTLDYITTSGDLCLYDSFDLVQQNGKYICNGGGCELRVNTVSGDLGLH